MSDTAVASSGTSDFTSSPDAAFKPSPVGGVSMASSGASAESTAALNSVRRCRTGCLTFGMKRRFKEVEQAMNTGLAAKKRDRAIIVPNNPLRPVAYSAPQVPANSLLDIMSISTEDVLVKYSSESKVTVDGNGTIVLSKGSVILRALNKAKVRVGECNISLRKGAIVLVTRDEKHTKIENLVDTTNKSVKVSARGHHVSLNVGQEVVLGENERELWSAMRDDMVARRRVTLSNCGKAGVFGVSDYSLITLLQNANLLKMLYASSERADRKMVASMMKMSVCLQRATSSHGSYHPVNH